MSSTLLISVADYQATPVYDHACSTCRFLEHSYGWDWYVCMSGRGANSVLGYTVLGRYGSDGSEYWSMDESTLMRNSTGLSVMSDGAPVTSLSIVWAARVLRQHHLIQ